MTAALLELAPVTVAAELSATVQPPQRLVTMLYGSKLIGRAPNGTYAPNDGWNAMSVETITKLMADDSHFMTYLYMGYDELLTFAQINGAHTWGEAGIGSLTVYGRYNADSTVQSTTVKFNDRPSTVHVLSDDYLRSFGPKPQREVGFDGGRRFHRMWFTALVDIAYTFLRSTKQINQRDFPEIVKQGFTSMLFGEIVIVRDVKPAHHFLDDPQITIVR